MHDSLRYVHARSVRNALAGNLSPSLTACNMSPDDHALDDWSVLYCFLRSAPRCSFGNWSIGDRLVTDHRSPFWVICPLTSLPTDPSVATGYWPPITSLDDLRSPFEVICSLISLSPGPRVTLRVAHVIIFYWHHQLPMTDRITNKAINQSLSK